MEGPSEENFLAQADTIFKEAISGSVSNISDPRMIKDEISDLKGFSSKLKFQYLEQESRDKFLRLLLIDDSSSVSQEAVDVLEKDNARAKAEVKQLKTELESVIQSSEQVAEEVISMNRIYEARKASLAQASEDLELAQKELDELLNASSSENYKMLFNLNKMIDSEDLGLNEAIDIAQNALDQDMITLSELSDEERSLKTKEQAQEKTRKELENKLQSLQSLSQQANQRAEPEQEPEQIYAQSLRELNALLRKLVPSEVAVEETDGLVTLSVGKNSVVVDRTLSIVSCTEATLDRAMIEAVNNAPGGKKSSQLRRALEAFLKHPQ